MRTNSAKHNQTIIRKALKLGDLNIIKSISETKLLRTILLTPKEGFLELIIQYLKFSTAAFAHSIDIVFRYQFGKNTTGLFMGTYVIAMLIIFNTDIFFLFKPFLNFIVILLPFFIDNEQLSEYLYNKTLSKSLSVYTVIAGALIIKNIVNILLKKGNKDTTKRGNSWLYKWLKRFNFIKESTVQTLIEPFLTALIGLAFYKLFDDLWMAIYLWMAALSVVTQELIDNAERNDNLITLGTGDD